MWLGVAGLVVLCPIVQWLEIGGTETSSFSAIGVPPVAVVMLCGLVLGALLAGLIKKFSPRADFIMLYAMFSIGTLVCSSGLVRPIYGHITPLMDELLKRKVDTVRVGYEWQKASVFPKLTTPLIPEAQAKTIEERQARDVAYADLIEFTDQLRRSPRDVPPMKNHTVERYRLTDEQGRLTQIGVKLGWWWRERFLHDAFGGVKKDVEAWKEIEKGAGTQPSGALAGYPDKTIERLKADRPGGMGKWFSRVFLSEVQVTHGKQILDGTGAVVQVDESRVIPWHLWGWPIFNWTVFSLLVIGMLTCLSEVLRRLWLQNENLPMPLVEVPNGIMSWMPGSPVSSGPKWMMTVGMLVGIIWVSMPAATHYRIPGLQFFPGLGIQNLTPMFATYPWKFIGTVWLCYHPLLICIGLLVTLEISRSIWTTTWLCNLALVVLGVVGISAATMPTPREIKGFEYRNFPFWDDQIAGAMLVMTMWMMWASRKRLVDMLAGLWRKPNPEDLGDALISPRVLPVLLVALMIALPSYAWFMGATSIKFLVMLFGLFFAFAIAAARLRAETGFLIVPAMTTMSRYNLMFAGAKTFGAEAASTGNSFFFLSSSLISVILPQQLEIMSLAQRQRVSLRRLGLGMMLAAVVALAVSMPFLLIWQYGTAGGVSPVNWTSMAGGKDGVYTLYRFAGRNLDQGRFETVRLVATGVGGLIMFVLLFLRSRFLGFPIHPIGYVATGAFVTGLYFNVFANINMIWGPMLIAWLIKRTIYKIGGNELFTRLLPLIRGVIIGHLGAIVFWAVWRQIFMPGTEGLFFTW